LKLSIGFSLAAALSLALGLGCIDGGPGGPGNNDDEQDGGTGVLEIIDEGFGDGGRPINPDADASVAMPDDGAPGGGPGGGGMPPAMDGGTP
jgi:hypothetical protein